MMLARIFICLALTAIFSTPSAWAQSRTDVIVYAPGRLKEPLDELARAYERQGRARAEIVYDPAPELARRIEGGAAADLLVSDDADSLDMLAKRGLIRIETRIQLLTMRQPQRVYEVAIVSASRAKVAYDYLRYLRSHAAQDVWQRHGFSPGK